VRPEETKRRKEENPHGLRKEKNNKKGKEAAGLVAASKKTEKER
jgi:hypothetical protein